MKSQRKSWLLLPCLGVLGLVISCTNVGRGEVGLTGQEVLELEILPNASKMFVYRFGRHMPPNAAKVGSPPGAPLADIEGAERYRRGRRPEALSEDKLRDRAAVLVASAGFCREGFLLLDRRLSPRDWWLRGECRENASDEDLRVFGAHKILDAQAWLKMRDL